MVAHFWIDEFLVAVERRRDPRLVGRPVVIGGAAHSAARVVAASSEARSRGVGVGQPLSEAWRRCPDATFLPGLLVRVQEAAAGVEEAVRRILPELTWTGLDQVTARLPAGGAPAYHLAERACQAIVRDTGFRVACGVARGWTAARVAAAMGRPAGIVHVLPGYDADFVRAAAVESLPFGDARTGAWLRALGLRTASEVAATTDVRVARLLGDDLHRLRRAVTGADEPAATLTRTPRLLRRELDLQPGSAAGDPGLHARLLALATDLANALHHFGCSARAVTLRVEDAAGESRALWHDLPGPTRAAAPLYRAITALLPRLLGPGTTASRVVVVVDQLHGVDVAQPRAPFAPADSPARRPTLVPDLARSSPGAGGHRHRPQVRTRAMGDW